jgi:hypothetical protein
MTLFLALFIVSTDPAWSISGTGIYNRINSRSVCLGENNSLFLADFIGRRILHFDQSSQLVNQIGRKGNGPGEFQVIDAVVYVDGRLYAMDSLRGRVQVFDSKGIYRDTLEAPRHALMLQNHAKVAGSGWVYINQDEGTLIRCDRDFQNPRVIARVEKRYVLEQTADRSIYHPAADRIRMDTNVDGSEIFVYLPGTGFTIFRYDGETGELLGKIEKDFEPLPFDREWGEKKFEAFLERAAGKYYMQAREARYPKYFPHIFGLEYDPEGFLRIQRGNLFLSPERSGLVLDMQGKEVRDAMPDPLFRRVLAHNKDWVYLANYEPIGDDETELTITRLDWGSFKKSYR